MMIFCCIQTHIDIQDNPIIKKFFEYDDNFQLLLQIINEPTDQGKISMLNERFSIYFTNVKRMNYISKLIRGIAIDYDKKTRKYSNRFVPTDSFVKEESSVINTDDILNEDFESLITNQNLLMAIKSLTPIQVKILEMYFIHDKNNLEIATHYNTTPQNVSQIRRKAIKKLQSHIKNKRVDLYVS